MEDLNKKNVEKPFGVEKITDLFEGSIVYYSGSIKGTVSDPLIGYEVVSFMLENGARVPSAHVAARDSKEMQEIFHMMSGKGYDENGEEARTPEIAYEVDMAWVDNATHVVAIVDGPSHGVGMEIMRAMLKPSRGLNLTPVLCLVHQDNLAKVSWMISGAHIEFGDNIKLLPYSSIEDANEIVKNFLLDKRVES